MISKSVSTGIASSHQNGTFWQLIKDVAGIVPEEIVVILMTILVIVLDLKKTIIT